MTATKPLTFGSLFAGIGGFDLGFERAGMVCKWQVEINEYSQRVLAKHWPHVPRWDDVRTWPQPDTEPVDLICGGFPCQDISLAGHGEGLAGERSGLFYEIIRIVRELEPRIIVLENVSALLVRGLGDVLGELAEIGFDAEWHCIPAAAVGAPHPRDRIWIVAYRKGIRRTGAQDPICGVGYQGVSERWAEESVPIGRLVGPGGRHWWDGESPVARVVHGVPARLVDRPNRACGNAVVPQVAEWIGRRIVENF